MDKNLEQRYAERRAKINVYRFDGNVGYCKLRCGLEFKFDAEDYNKIKDYTWSKSAPYIVNRYMGVYLHKFLFGNPNCVVDHIDGDPYNNTKANLRMCTQAENTRNLPVKRSNNTTGYKGVILVPSTGHYRARIVLNYHTCNIGTYPTAEEAAHAYDRKAIELFGEFARTNFPREYYEEKKEEVK